MTEPQQPPAALEGLRVLDLTGAMGNYAGKLFADMGADVILVEPPGGTELRREPPFIGDVSGPDRSLNFAYQNSSKRGIALDLETPSGQQILRDLARDADLVIETFPPGWSAERGIGYGDLAAQRPGIVVASITPFGQSGPFAQWTATDLVGLALGGLLYMGGYRDRAPTQAHGDQAFKCAAMYGAVAAMLAVTEAELMGQGQHVDISMQESVTLALENAAQTYDLEGNGAAAAAAGAALRRLWAVRMPGRLYLPRLARQLATARPGRAACSGFAMTGWKVSTGYTAPNGRISSTSRPMRRVTCSVSCS